MKISVRYFAHLRERLRKEVESVELSDGATVGDLLTQLAAAEPLILASRRSVQVAVNMEFAPQSTPLKDGDEVALIPPVAGGSVHVRVSLVPFRYLAVFSALSCPCPGALVLFSGLVSLPIDD